MNNPKAIKIIGINMSIIFISILMFVGLVTNSIAKRVQFKVGLGIKPPLDVNHPSMIPTARSPSASVAPTSPPHFPLSTTPHFA